MDGGFFIKEIHVRRVRKDHGLDIYDKGDDIMIVDSTCGQSRMHSSACRIMSNTSIFFHADGAMSGMYSSEALMVKNIAVMVVVFKAGKM